MKALIFKNLLFRYKHKEVWHGKALSANTLAGISWQSIEKKLVFGVMVVRRRGWWGFSIDGSPEKPAEGAPEHGIYFAGDQGLAGRSHLLVFLSCSGHCPGRERLVLLVYFLEMWFLTLIMKAFPWEGGHADHCAKIISLPLLHSLSIQGIAIRTHD